MERLKAEQLYFLKSCQVLEKLQADDLSGKFQNNIS